MRIREYTAEDEASCIAIFRSNQPKYFDESELEPYIEWLRSRRNDSSGVNPYFIIEDEGLIHGCGGIYRDDEKGHAGLAWGMVLNASHGKGYGKDLLLYRLQKLEEISPDMQIVCDTSQHTYGFFKKYGFELKSIEEDSFAPGIHKYHMVKPAKLKI